MKKMIIPLFAMVTATIVFFACRKNEQVNTAPQEKFTITDAKEWWWGTFRKSPEYSTIDEGSDFYKLAKMSFGNREGFIYERRPAWNMAKAYERGSVQYVEVPLLYNNKINIIQNDKNLSATQKNKVFENKLDRLLLIKKNGKIEVRVITIVPTYNYLANHNFDISFNSYEKFDNRFSGSIEYRYWNEKLIINLKYNNGQLVKSRKKNLYTSSKTTTNTSVMRENMYECPESYQTSCTGGEWGTIDVHICFQTYTGGGDDPSITACSHTAGINATCNEWICPGDGDGDTPIDCATNPNFASQQECECALLQIGCGDNGGGGDDTDCSTEANNNFNQLQFNNVPEGTENDTKEVESSSIGPNGDERKTMNYNWMLGSIIGLSNGAVGNWRLWSKDKFDLRTLGTLHPWYITGIRHGQFDRYGTVAGVSNITVELTNYETELHGGYVGGPGATSGTIKKTAKVSLYYNCPGSSIPFIKREHFFSDERTKTASWLGN